MPPSHRSLIGEEDCTFSIGSLRHLSFFARIFPGSCLATLFSCVTSMKRGMSHRCSALSPNGLQRVPCLPHCRNHAELLQQTQVVTVAPQFDALAIGEAGDGDPCCHHLFARGCNAHEVALLGATKRVASYDSVSFSDDVLNSEMGIGEGVEVERE